MKLHEAEAAEVEARWRELWTWLGSALDDFGLDAPLYARCLLSILRQPPSALQESESESEAEEEALAGGGGRRAGSADSARAEDARAAALAECLSTAELPGRELSGLVDELLRRYGELEKASSRQTAAAPNESVDSGVCPSPETADSFQNYDEAFPPLLELGGTEFLGKPPPLPLPRPEEETPVAEEAGGGGGDDDTVLQPQAPPPSEPIMVGWASGWRRKSPACLLGSLPARGSRLSAGLPFTTQWTRPNSELRPIGLNGSGQMEWWTGGRGRQPSELYGSGLKEVGGLTQLTSMPTQSSFFSATPPTFVVPKFRGSAVTSVKVGSCPSKLEFGYSGPPGTQCDLWTWLSAQTASVHANNQAGQPPPPSPGLPDLDSSADFPALRTINEDPQPQLPAPAPPTGLHRWALGAEEGRQVYPSLAEEAPLEPWEALDSTHLDAGNFSFNFDPATDCYLEPPSVEEEQVVPDSPPGFVVPRLAQMGGSDSARTGGRGFQSIRSESMEFAFTPRPRHPSPGSYAVDYLCGEEWFVLRDGQASSRLASRPRTRQSSVCTEASEPKRRRASGKSDTLPLKFQASKPAKMVQTEPQGHQPPLLDQDDVCNNNSLVGYDRGWPWERWREDREWGPAEAEEREEWRLPESPPEAFFLPRPALADSEGRRMVSLGAGSSIWEAVPRTCVWEWGLLERGEATEAERPVDTASEAADDDLLLNLVGSISVTAPL